MNKCLILILVIFLVSCGDDPIIIPDPDPEPTAQPTSAPTATLPPATPAPTPKPPRQNPTCTGEMPFSNGTLWKPKADENSWIPGKLVVLLDNRFTKDFDRCEVRRRNRALYDLRRFPKSNGDRQTWRSESLEGKQHIDDGFIRCYGEGQVCVWRFFGYSGDRHE